MTRAPPSEEGTSRALVGWTCALICHEKIKGTRTATEKCKGGRGGAERKTSHRHTAQTQLYNPLHVNVIITLIKIQGLNKHVVT